MDPERDKTMLETITIAVVSITVLVPLILKVQEIAQDRNPVDLQLGALTRRIALASRSLVASSASLVMRRRG